MFCSIRKDFLQIITHLVLFDGIETFVVVSAAAFVVELLASLPFPADPLLFPPFPLAFCVEVDDVAPTAEDDALK